MSRIIIIEDEVLWAMDLADILSEAGHSIEGIAVSAENALTLAKQTQPDLAVVDVHLEGEGNGVTLAAILHREWGIRSIMITGASTAGVMDGEAIVGWLSKPFHPHELLFLLDKHKSVRQPTESDMVPVRDENSTLH